MACMTNSLELVLTLVTLFCLMKSIVLRNPQVVHWLACMTNSLGLVLTLVTLSSNCLKLTTSLLEGYINGQVKVAVKKEADLYFN